MGALDLLERWLTKAMKWGDGAAPTMPHEHIENHKGNAFSTGYLVTGVADADQIALLLWNPEGIGGKEGHFTLEGLAGGRAYAFLYEGTEIFTTGTVLESVRLNRVRDREGVLDPAEWMLAGGPTINELGTLRGVRFIPGSAAATPNAAHTPGNVKSGFEWILDPYTAYLLVMFNDSGATVPQQFVTEWYEEEQGEFGGIV